jgi:glycosyltransferase involved in cell wall biosynthesis
MPVDGVRFHPDPAARVRGRIGFSGRIDDPRKNIPLLLEAYARLRQQGHDVSLRLIGGTVTAAISEAVRRLGLEGQVEFVPHVSADELAAHLRTLDVFVLPSHQEGLCIAALEAMASGVPVVSTRCGGPEEFVIPGQSGQLVAFDADDMAQAIADLLRDPHRREALGQGARSVVERRYTFHAARASLGAALLACFPELQNFIVTGPELP